MTSLPAPLCGIVPPLVTPLADRDALDAAGLDRLVDHVVEGGAAGLFVLGTCGEGVSLSGEVRVEVIRRVCRQAAGRVPVLCSVTDTCPAETLALAQTAAQFGAAAVVLSAPYYYPLSRRELMHYIRRAAEAMPLPIFLYNIPSHTRTVFGLEIIRRALDLPNVVGLKDSSGDMEYFHQVHRLRLTRPDWTLLVGPEELLAEAVLLGGNGGVCGGGLLSPRLYVELFRAASRRDMAQVAALHEVVMTISRNVYGIGRRRPAVIAGLKHGLAVLGVCGDRMAEPLSSLGPARRERIRRTLRQLSIDLPGYFRPVAEDPPPANPAGE
jgi:dihydrodipicolinate synthase/N-acetylneuraminate lyase